MQKFQKVILQIIVVLVASPVTLYALYALRQTDGVDLNHPGLLASQGRSIASLVALVIVGQIYSQSNKWGRLLLFLSLGIVTFGASVWIPIVIKIASTGAWDVTVVAKIVCIMFSIFVYAVASEHYKHAVFFSFAFLVGTIIAEILYKGLHGIIACGWYTLAGVVVNLVLDLYSLQDIARYFRIKRRLREKGIKT